MQDIFKNTKFSTLEFKLVKNKSFENEYRANLRVKGVFGIRFYYKQRYYAYDVSESWTYGWIINGKRYGGEYSLFCSSEQECIEKCQFKYEEICSKILNEIIKI